MESLSPGLAGHKGLRGQLLLELKRAQPLTASELGARFAVSANAVRRHLKELESEGLVLYDREQRGQGAPTYVYRLSQDGEKLFPRRYDEALTDVLRFVAETNGREEVHRIFAERFRAHAEHLNARLADANLEERVSAVVELLSGQGFMADWSRDQGTVRIEEHNCAVQAAAAHFPEICAAEADFLRQVLKSDVRREEYIPDGCNSCRYAVSVTDSGSSEPHAATDSELREEL